MNNSKEERSAFMKSFGEAIFLLPLPIVIVALLVVVRVNLPGFWTEIITLFSATVISLVIANRPAATDEYDDFEITFRNLLIISAGGTMLMALINRNNTDQNYFGSVLWVVVIALVVFFLAILFAGGNFKVWQDGKYTYYSGFSKLIAIFAITGMLVEMYVHFGTQFIWVPMITLTCFIEIFFTDPIVRRHLDFSEGQSYLRYLSWVPAVAALVSTVYQFWFSEIVYGYELWQILIGVAGVLAIIGVIILCKKGVKKNKAKKMENQKKAEQEEQEAKEANKRLALVTLAFKAIEDEVMWNEILYLVRYYNQDINKFSSILPKIHKAPLEQVVSISKIKNHIVWTDDFPVALQVIEKLAARSYKDDELQLLIKQVADFIALIGQYKEFKGYNEAMEQLKARCSTVFKLLPKE